jgi:hypothetical protein
MNLSEPMTAVTDYLLAGVTAWLCILLFKHRESQRCRFFWAVAFAALAVGAFIGGTWHGLVRSDVLWKATLVMIGVASCSMLAGSLLAALTGAVRNILLWFTGGKLLLYLSSLLERGDFMVVIIDTGIAFAAVAALHLWRWNGWIVAGVGASVAAALVQASGLALHEHFNHNDLYHVIQIAAMALLYRGARRLRDASSVA